VYLDILIFAIIAAFLIYRLNAVLGTRHGDERPRPNPFAGPEKPARPLPPLPPLTTVVPMRKFQQIAESGHLIDHAANKEGQIAAGLAEIAAVDPAFDVEEFITGAKYAFDTIVEAYAKGDRKALQPLLSPKLYADFDQGITAREAGQAASVKHHIKSARILRAHLGGTMAYITIDYDVEQSTDPGHVTTVEDIWTFTRDTRSSDPNWILIETSAAEKL
jgi:predicted lipid-binding transport protein (Tim44 family)